MPKDLPMLDSRLRSLRRRTLLKAGALSTFGLGLPDLLQSRQEARAEAAGGGKAKSCILLYMTGGPAQQETFDLKPSANDGYRGEFSAIPTSVPGFEVCEHLPMLAKTAERFSVIRSTFHNSGTHGVGVHYNLTGLPHAKRQRGEPQMDRRDPPCVGGVIRQLRGDRNGLPAAVHLPVRIGDQNNFQWGGQHAGFLGPQYDPLLLIDENWTPGSLPPGFTPPKEVLAERQSGRAELLKTVQLQRNSKSTAEDRYGRFQNLAIDILNAGNAWRAFDLDEEKPETIERYGDNKFGRSCLVARRLVEAGVGLVTVPWMFLHSTKNFDTHKDHFKLMKTLLLPPLDRAFSALLEDLDDRGMLDETLVAWTGEFGRTPKINKGAGRDHWGQVYSTVLAGGGIQGGRIHGASDNIGGHPTDKPVHTRDFVASMYHALGYGADTRVTDPTGRPFFVVAGRPVRELF
ncbi:MAG: DUF1501 domain-containing protein [Planctomycetaceae bacterium]|jgi:hypothetical protein|nr:DUF1501 domain-containing protein [Planctomycetaceae bacterium]MBT6156712.1 DUF1501 domain-containing protein [Planctomycetaceae bacterium]MBT6486112.1 DUF1501 domain-containing protein [Planctomycetaceae bacterium]MBT6493119.1 DUF1501 domain-containing protein [Planctomycetaceae bacterium]